MKKYIAALIIIFLVSLVVSLTAYPYIPDKMASHWNTRGEVDGWVNKEVGLFVIPVVELFCGMLLLIVMSVFRRRESIKANFISMGNFLIALFLFLLMIHMQMILWSIGIRISPNIVMPLGIGGLIFYVGHLFKKVKTNWVFGIRTPWNFKSEYVWKKNHEFGSIVFRVAGVIMLLGALVPQYAFWFIIAPVLLAAILCTIHSYVVWKKLQQTDKSIYE